jgi:hypothetical protein
LRKNRVKFTACASASVPFAYTMIAAPSAMPTFSRSAPFTPRKKFRSIGSWRMSSVVAPGGRWALAMRSIDAFSAGLRKPPSTFWSQSAYSLSPVGTGAIGMFAGTMPLDGPDGATAYSPPGTPPQNCLLSNTSPSGMPIGTSYTPGRATSPLIENSRRPPNPAVVPGTLYPASA